MERITCRLLPYQTADGPTNMARDEALLISAADDRASLRFYGWSEATASLGYFQSAQVRHANARLSVLPYVRRASGGATLVHHRELTYAISFPLRPPWSTRESWLTRMHMVIAGALAKLGASCVVVQESKRVDSESGLCFQQHTPGDLLCSGSKVVGSAQRKSHNCLLQHGAILLAQSPHTPELPGIMEQTGYNLPIEDVRQTVRRELFADTGWDFVISNWSDEELSRIETLRETKYGSDVWNDKR